jgi:hypothetical protein
MDQEIADLRACIKKAASERDHWRGSGRQDKYYEAYFLVNALEVQLNRVRRQRLEAAVRSERYVYPREAAVASPGPNPNPVRRAAL